MRLYRDVTAYSHADADLDYTEYTIGIDNLPLDTLERFKASIRPLLLPLIGLKRHPSVVMFDAGYSEERERYLTFTTQHGDVAAAIQALCEVIIATE